MGDFKYETRIIKVSRSEIPTQPRFPDQPSNIFTKFIEIDHPEHGKIRVTEQVQKFIKKNDAENCPQRSPEWFEKRREHITASAVAAALGENKYTSRTKLIQSKVWKPEEFKTNPAIEHGQKYEDYAVEAYEKFTGFKVLNFGLLESIHPETEGFVAGSPDGITTDGRLIEVKCPLYRTSDGSVPPMYMHQIQCTMNILDIDICDFIEYAPADGKISEELWITEVKRSNEYWDATLPRLKQFWKEVLEIRDIEGPGVAERSPPPKQKRAKRIKRRHVPLPFHALDMQPFKDTIKAAEDRVKAQVVQVDPLIDMQPFKDTIKAAEDRVKRQKQLVVVEEDIRDVVSDDGKEATKPNTEVLNETTPTTSFDILCGSSGINQ